MHAAPLDFKPQELFAQVLGGTQSSAAVASVQLDLQLPLTQAKLPHGCVVAGVRQAPLPSQLEAGVTEDGEAQTAGAQLRPAS